ncbi:hypothetical protein J5X84_00120 [Streptosporangiaceae bacterium NEAU-GS5]|nr:hypothetical protein [Streptosporangiaceae bacterium NEAU-GS5]
MSFGLRVARAVGIWLVMFGGLGALGLLAEATFADFGFGFAEAAIWSPVLGPLLSLLLLSRLASYRRRDCVWFLLLLTLPYGLWLAVVVGWRLALLPYRDWRPRPDEMARLERISVPEDDRVLYKRR